MCLLLRKTLSRGRSGLPNRPLRPLNFRRCSRSAFALFLSAMFHQPLGRSACVRAARFLIPISNLKSEILQTLLSARAGEGLAGLALALVVGTGDEQFLLGVVELHRDQGVDLEFKLALGAVHLDQVILDGDLDAAGEGDGFLSDSAHDIPSNASLREAAKLS